MKRYLIKLSPPTPPEGEGEGGGGGGDATVAGRTQPQIGNKEIPSEANMLQEGSGGGI